MSQPIRPLREVVAEIPDGRHARGKRHPLPAVLLLSLAAMLCGYRSYAAIAAWGRNYGPEVLAALGFTRVSPPCAATLYRIFRSLDVQVLEARLGAWAAEVLAALPVAEGTREALALDGKTLRGSRKAGAPGAHLLSALSHRLGLTVRQEAIPAKKGEQAALHTLLAGLLIEGRVLTMDSLHTTKRVARTIVQRHGFYVMIVKRNQPQVRDDIATLFTEPEMVRDTFTEKAATQCGHGRVERRRLTASTALRGFTRWPGLRQVFQIERTVITKATGECRRAIVYGLTNLSPAQASASALLQDVQAHWLIENRSHWVRDVTFDEDRSQVRTGTLPHVLATLRCTTLGLLRLQDTSNIAAACRHYAARPWAALGLLGISPTMK